MYTHHTQNSQKACYSELSTMPTLTDLPLKLRSHVYHYTLVDDEPQDVSKSCYAPHPMLQVSQQLRRECLPVCYGTNTFQLKLRPFDRHRTVSALVKLMGKEATANIRLLQVDLFDEVEFNTSLLSGGEPQEQWLVKLETWELIPLMDFYRTTLICGVHVILRKFLGGLES